MNLRGIGVYSGPGLSLTLIIMKRNWLIFFSLLPLLGQAQPDIKQVTVFKNGLGFVQRQGNVTTGPNGMWRQNPLPQARFGTLWSEGDYTYMASYQDTVYSQKDAETLRTLWLANRGKKATVYLNDDARTAVEGTLDTALASHLILKTAQGARVFAEGYIADLQLQGEAGLRYKDKTIEPVLAFGFGKPNQSFALRQSYLTMGLSWVPACSIELLEGKKAKMTLRATLVNDAEALKEVRAQFAVGVPNFKFSSQTEPLISWLNGSVPPYEPPRPAGYMRNEFANIAVQTVSYDESMPVNTTSADEGQNEDLFFYTIDHISLPKGGRGAYTLLEADLTYEDIFETDLPTNGDEYRATLENSDKDPIPVQHKIRLKNTTQYPWTTAPALVTKVNGAERAPIAQDQLNYTPPGACATVPITTAPEVRLMHTEQETGREESKKMRDGYYYDLVTVEAKVEVQNFGKREAPLLLHRVLSGELMECSVPMKQRKLTRQLNPQNYLNQVDWELNLKAGEKLSYTYTYKVYVRR